MGAGAVDDQFVRAEDARAQPQVAARVEDVDLDAFFVRAPEAHRREPRGDAPAASGGGDDEVAVKRLLGAARAIARADAGDAIAVAEEPQHAASVVDDHVRQAAHPPAHKALEQRPVVTAACEPTATRGN